MILIGDRVVVRPFGEADISEAYLGWLNDPVLTRFSNQRFASHDRASAERYRSAFAGTPHLFLSLRRRADDVPIGTMTAYRAVPHATADLGILIGRENWGRGFGQEAWSLVLDHLLSNGVRKATAGTLAGNVGMIRLAERAGMTLEATRRAQEIVDGEPQDMLLYARFAA